MTRLLSSLSILDANREISRGEDFEYRRSQRGIGIVSSSRKIPTESFFFENSHEEDCRGWNGKSFANLSLRKITISTPPFCNGLPFFTVTLLEKLCTVSLNLSLVITNVYEPSISLGLQRAVESSL